MKLVFFKGKQEGLSDSDKREFLGEITEVAIRRERWIAYLLIPVHIALFFLTDLPQYQQGLWATIPGYRYLFFLHLILIAVLTLYILASFLLKKQHARYALVWTTALLTLLFCVAVSLADQLIHGQISVLILGALAIAALVNFPPISGTLLFMIPAVVFIVFLPQVQSNLKMLTGHYINAPILLLLAWFFSRILYRARFRQFIDKKTIESTNQQLAEANTKQEELLENILPLPVIQELKIKGHSLPKENPNTTVVFTDFISFTRIVENNSAGLIVNTLERLFGQFDKIVQHYGLEKLKTIGDGYMYAGGLFEEGNQVEQAVLAAQEIIAFVERETEKLKEQTGFEWCLRIGIHTGPTITGIIGKWRFLYDVWGNTVNIAARMEAASSSNRINVSKPVHDSLRDKFDFEYRGVLPIKNLQPIEMFFVQRGTLHHSTDLRSEHLKKS